MPNNFLLILISVLPAVIIFVELFLLLPVVKTVIKLRDNSSSAVRLIKDANISDEEKGRVMRQHSLTIMICSLQILFYLLILLLAFATVYILLGWLLLASWQLALNYLWQLWIQAVIVVFGIIYSLLRQKIKNNVSRK